MVTTDVQDRIREVMAGVLELPPAAIVAGFARDGNPRWDSLTHLRLVTALEEAFGIRFDMREVSLLSRFEAIQSAVERRL
jgi:acyl carrier protein